MTIKLISLDFDGTLLNNSSRLTPHTIDVLRKLSDRGILIFPNTGRGIEVLRPLIDELSFVEYFAGLNGGTVYHRDTVIDAHELPHDTAVRIAEVFERLGVFYFVVVDGYYFDRNGKRKQIHPAIPLSFQDEYTDYIRDHSLYDFVKACTRRIYKIVALFDEDAYGKVLLEELKDIEGIRANPSRHGNLEVNAASAGKGKAVEFMRDLFGLKNEEILSIGDNDNDIGMMLEGAVNVCLSNGTEGLKKVCTHVTDLDNDHDGAADFLEKYFDL